MQNHYHGLTDEAIRRAAPSVFAAQAISTVSERYSFLPTASILSGMRANGWIPTRVEEQRVVKAERHGFQKHLLRFAQIDDVLNGRKERFEVAVVNAHDGKNAYEVRAGMLRLACLNGWLISDDTVQAIRIRHSGFNPDQVIEATFDIAAKMPVVESDIESFKAKALSPREQQALAIGAHAMRWPEGAVAPVAPQALLEARRADDKGDRLWETLNRVQENVIRGGQSVRPVKGRRQTSRRVTGIDTESALNRAMWKMATYLRDGKLPEA